MNTSHIAAHACLVVLSLTCLLPCKVLFAGHPVDVLHILNNLKLPVFLLYLHAAYVPYYKVIDFKKSIEVRSQLKNKVLLYSLIN